MNRSTYQKMPLREIEKWQCRLTREVRTGVAVYPAGMPCTIYGKRGGLHVDGPPCEHCGVKPHIIKLEPRDVELVHKLEDGQP